MYSRKPFLHFGAISDLFTGALNTKAAEAKASQERGYPPPFRHSESAAVRRASRSKYMPHVGNKISRWKSSGEKRLDALRSMISKNVFVVPHYPDAFIYTVGNLRNVTRIMLIECGYEGEL